MSRPKAHDDAGGQAARLPPHELHRSHAPREVACLVVTTSDSRTKETDEGGRLLMELLREGGHTVVGYHLIRDEVPEIERVLRAGLDDPRVQAILFTGGTGISRRDQTYEVIEHFLRRRFGARRIDGFGELFRFLSYQEIGPAAMLSRAVAGVLDGKVVVSLPGSPAAVRLAMTKLILPELGHLVGEVNR
ncbi:MAG TPA: MogA/MoaB family molybdenum cofactor biosynthesis protein [Thermodesulfobacteriota bacterium]|nr:MogA/MoaB family molybdenum cofactor biosynthesis protein [Thermodesulfobacteriota bacterium]